MVRKECMTNVLDDLKFVFLIQWEYINMQSLPYLLRFEKTKNMSAHQLGKVSKVAAKIKMYTFLNCHSPLLSDTYGKWSPNLGIPALTITFKQIQCNEMFNMDRMRQVKKEYLLEHLHKNGKKGFKSWTIKYVCDAGRAELSPPHTLRAPLRSQCRTGRRIRRSYPQVQVRTARWS